jgi:hypothetical protein
LFPWFYCFLLVICVCSLIPKFIVEIDFICLIYLAIWDCCKKGFFFFEKVLLEWFKVCIFLVIFWQTCMCKTCLMSASFFSVIQMIRVDEFFFSLFLVVIQERQSLGVDKQEECLKGVSWIIHVQYWVGILWKLIMFMMLCACQVVILVLITMTNSEGNRQIRWINYPLNFPLCYRC